MSENNADANGFTNNVTVWSTHGGPGYGLPIRNFATAPADTQSTVNSAPIQSNVSNPGKGVAADNAGQPLVVTKDSSGKTLTVHGTIAGVTVNNPA